MIEERSCTGQFPIENAYAAVVGYVLGAYIDFVSDEEIRLDWGEREYSSHRKIRGRDAYRPVDSNLEDWKRWMTLQVAGFANLPDESLEINTQLRELARQAVGDDSREITKFIIAAKKQAERILDRNEEFRDYLTTRLLFGTNHDRYLDADEFSARANAFNVRRQRRAIGRSDSVYRALECALADRCGSAVFSIAPESTPRRVVFSSTTSDDHVIQAAVDVLAQRGYCASVAAGQPVHILAVRSLPEDG